MWLLANNAILTYKNHCLKIEMEWKTGHFGLLGAPQTKN